MYCGKILVDGTERKRFCNMGCWKQMPEVKQRYKDIRKKYNCSVRGKETQKRAEQSAKGRLMHKKLYKKYYQTTKGKLWYKKYNRSVACKIAQRKYKQSVKGRLLLAKACKTYKQTEKGKERYVRYHHSDKRKITCKKYKQSEKGVLMSRKHSQIRRVRKVGVIHRFTNEEWRKKVNLTKGICPGYKREPHFVGINKLAMDHTPPLSKVPVGFVYTINDVNPLCKSCNSSKNNICEIIIVESRGECAL